MKKKKLLAALVLCTAVSFNAYGFAATHEFNVNSVIDKTYDGYVSSGYGGAISNSMVNNPVPITNSIFSNNQATGSSSMGGAIYSQGGILRGGNLNIDNSKFTNNSLLNSSQGGGAIALYVRAKAAETTISNSLFQGNKANVTSTSGTVLNSDGGAILVTGGVLKINNTQFIGNEADIGGAIATRLASTNTIVNISNNSYFKENKATGAGGALAFFNKTGTNTISDSTFEGNSTLSSTLDGGGAIFLGAETKTTISNTIFKDNTSNSAGGAIATRAGDTSTATLDITGSSFKNNIAKNGGAIAHSSTGAMSIKDTSFENNNATTDGGALFINNASNTTIDNVAFNNNTAAGQGGAIRSTLGANVDIKSSTFTKNSADWYGAITHGVSGGMMNITDSVFTENEAGSGGAVANYAGKNANSGMTITNTQFISNKATLNDDDGGGALFLGAESKTNIQNSVFKDNYSGTVGGAIATRIGNGVNDNSKATLDITGSTFENNNARTNGGAIYNSLYNSASNNGSVNISSNNFINNTAGSRGGAIYTEKTADRNGGSANMTIDNSNFQGNSAQIGGAIAHHSEGLIDVKNSTFTGNNATIQGGAIVSMRNNTNPDAIVLNVENVVFNNNEAGAEGGAIWSGSKTNITNAVFNGNKTTGTTLSETPNYQTDEEGGGAVFVGSNSATSITGSSFTNNESGTVGGAIATRSNATNNGTTSLDITSSNFDGNSARVNGGALATYIDTSITDTSFTNNSAGLNGGAVWANKNLNINAENSNIVMSGNTAANGSDIFMNTANSNLNMNAAEGKSITVASGISGNNYNMQVNSNGGTGSLIINSAIQNATIDVQNGTFHLAQGSALNNSTLNMASGSTLNTINGQADTFGNNITLQDNVNLSVDVDLSNNKADNFSGANVQGAVTVTEVNTLGNTTANNVSINLAEALGINPDNMTISSALQSETQTVLTPIRYLSGSVSETGLLTMAPTGSGYKDFNPSVMASPIAAQLGGYLTQLNSYDQAFRNMDMYMLMTKQQREALKLRNKYAAADGNLIFDPTGNQYDDRAAWVRPYATFENVPLKGGPRVSNVAYGSFFGVDSEMYDLGNGWDGMLSFYAGYNGSHQAYDGIGIYQNGGTIGVVGMAYKGNFFTGLTINAGANAGEASTYYGTDNFAMLMAGIASKTGYNFELADGKFIIQPSLQLSYSFVNTFDYTNAAGVRMSSDPLNAIQVEPGIKFIGNLKNGWQPYAGVSVVWNIMDKTNFHANNVSLPDLSVKPYVRYGLGVRKTWGERCVGFFQTYFTSGGRNGVGLQTGFRYTLGKGGNGSVSNRTPERPKTQLQLSNCDVSPKL